MILKAKVPTDFKINPDGYLLVPILGSRVQSQAVISREPVTFLEEYKGKKVTIGKPKVFRKALEESKMTFVEIEEVSGVKYFQVVIPVFESK